MRGTPRVLEVKPAEGWRVWVRFEDGLEAEVDLARLRNERGVFAPLRDPEYFREVAVYPSGTTIFWPNEADIAPETLYLWAREAAGVAA